MEKNIVERGRKSKYGVHNRDWEAKYIHCICLLIIKIKNTEAYI